MRPRLLSIQYVRAIAAIVVIGWHSGFSYTVLGQAGVDLFFVVSGFVMMLVSLRERSPLDFGLARICRIVPFYWIVTGVVALLDRPSAGALATSLLFWPDRAFPIVIQGWSLNLEMFYYLLFTLALLAPSGARLPTLAVEILVLCAVVPLLAPGVTVLAAYASPLALEFLAGAGLFWLWRRDWLPVGAAAWLMGGAGAVVLASSHLLGGAPSGLARVLFWGVPSFVIMAAGLGIERAGQLLHLRWFEALGDASYAIYLTHLLALRPVSAALHTLWAPAALVLAVLWACLIGLLIHRLLERPLNRGVSAALKHLRKLPVRVT